MRIPLHGMQVVLAIMVLGTSATLVAQQPSPPRFENIHVKEIPLQLALTSCYDRSPTCRNLIDTIQSSATIAIVGFGHCQTAFAVASSCLQFMANAGGFRYLRIALDPALRGTALVKMLAHELQHAVEIVRAPDVTGPDSLRALFASIGYRLDHFDSGNEWETTEARQIADLVVGELKEARRALLQARRDVRN